MTRLLIPELAELRADARELLTLIAPPGHDAPRTMTMLARQPDLLAPFLGWAAALALKGTLSKRDHEIVALRVARNCGSDFEWGEHAEYGRAAGLTDAEITRIAAPALDAAWTTAELALLRAADELGADTSITDATWSALTEHFDAGQIVEVVMVVGQYTMLSMLANATGITLPPASTRSLPAM